MGWAFWLPLLAALVSIVSSVAGGLGVLATIFITVGRFTQKLNDHTNSDERRFGEVSASLIRIEADIKNLLQRRR